MPFILDTDPGIDDAFAILTLLAAGQTQVLGLMAVSGNVPIDVAFRNLRNLAALAGRSDVPVFRGAEGPLIRLPRLATEVHGDDGLGGVAIAESPAPVEREHAVLATLRLMRQAREKVTWVAVGPLTNVALALRLDPSVVGRVERLVVMGGSLGRGNVTPAAEFNVWVDPEAWRVVVQSGIPMTMVGLNVTQAVPVLREDEAEVAAMSGQVARAAEGMLRFFRQVHAQNRWGEPKLHDVVAVLEALHPGIVQAQAARVDVECASSLTEGMTVVRTDSDGATRPNCMVGLGTDAAKIRRLLVEAIRSISVQ